MPTTSRGYPFPTVDDQTNVPADIQALAQAVNDDVDAKSPQRRLLSRSTTASIPNNSNTGINVYDVGIIDTAGTRMTYAAGKITVLDNCVCDWTGTVSFDGDSSNHKAGVMVLVDDIAYATGSVLLPMLGGLAYRLTGGGPLVLNAGQSVQLAVYQNSGSSMTVRPSTFGLTKRTP